VSWDLHRSAVRDRILASQAQAGASLANFDRTVLSALRETETSLDSYGAALEKLHRLKDARDQAMIVNEKTRELRQYGKVGGLVALDAERTWVNSELVLASTAAEVNNDQIEAFLALGGGWQ
jgi:outer membrane protein TolC